MPNKLIFYMSAAIPLQFMNLDLEQRMLHRSMHIEFVRKKLIIIKRF